MTAVKQNNKLKSLIKIIENINFHFLDGQSIKISEKQNGRIHLLYGTHEIFIDKNGNFVGACNNPIIQQ